MKTRVFHGSDGAALEDSPKPAIMQAADTVVRMATTTILTAEGGDQVIFSTVDAAVSTAVEAQRIFEDQGLEVRRAVIKAMRKTSIANAERWGRMAVEETKMGRAEDKTQKNLLCATRTPGVEDLQSRAYTGDNGLTLVEYAPFGVVAAITPSNNPAATVISNAIAILAAGNSVVFAPHPAAAKVCQEVMRALCSAAVSAGAPRGLVTTVSSPSRETTKALLCHSCNHRSAAMYSTNIGNLTRMGRRMQCSIFVKNAPTLYGLGLGEGYASMSIGTPTGDGITKPSHFVRPLHCCLVGYFRIA